MDVEEHWKVQQGGRKQESKEENEKEKESNSQIKRMRENGGRGK